MARVTVRASREFSRAAPLLLAAALAGCVSGGADVSYWKPSLSAEVRVSSDSLDGSLVDLQADLNVSNEDSIPVERFWLQVGASRYELGRWDLSVSGDATVDADFDFGGSTYSVDDEVSTDLDITAWRAAYLWCPKLGRLKAGVGLAVQWWEIEAELENETTGFDEELDESYPIPAVVAKVEIPISSVMSAFGEADALQVDIGDVEGRFIDFRAGLTFRLPRLVSATASYRRITTDIEIDDDSADIDFEGLSFAVEARW